MDELVHQKLLEQGYNPEKADKVLPGHLVAISQGYLGGLIVFSGRVTLSVGNSRVATVLEDDKMTLRYSVSNNLKSLYVRPLEYRIKAEYIRMEEIQPTDRIYITGVIGSQHRDTFSLVIEDARRNNIAALTFWKEGEMLYVPKRR